MISLQCEPGNCLNDCGEGKEQNNRERIPGGNGADSELKGRQRFHFAPGVTAKLHVCAVGRAFRKRKAPPSQVVWEGGLVGRVRGSRVSCSSLAEGQQRDASALCAPSAGRAPALPGSESPWEVSRHLAPSFPHQLHISAKATVVSLMNLRSNPKA